MNSQRKIFHTFSSQERYILINLVEQILELLGAPAVDHDSLNDFVGISSNELPPDDPVLRRLLPSAYNQIQDAAEFRRYTEHSLREKKRSAAHFIRELLINEDGGGDEIEENLSSDPIDPIMEEDGQLAKGAIKVAISESDFPSWLSGLNDIRLALAVRLEIGGGAMGDLPDGDHRSNSGDSFSNKSFELMKDSDPMKAVYAVYNWIGWLQEEFLLEIETKKTGPDL